jgi:hypothetical protein
MQFELLQGEELLAFYPARSREVPIGLLNDDSPADALSAEEREREREKFRWLANIVEPSQPLSLSPSLSSSGTAMADIPNLNVRLHHVYGYETTSVRNNLAFVSPSPSLSPSALSAGMRSEIVYTCGSYGVVWNANNASQKTFKVS